MWPTVKDNKKQSKQIMSKMAQMLDLRDKDFKATSQIITELEGMKK